GERQSSKPRPPMLASRPLPGDPAPRRRQPENSQRNTDRDRLVEALVENRVAIPVRRPERREPVQQQQVGDEQPPDYICHLVQAFPVSAKLSLRRGVGGGQQREGQEDYQK